MSREVPDEDVPRLVDRREVVELEVAAGEASAR